jgi:hypothetical protein
MLDLLDPVIRRALRRFAVSFAGQLQLQGQVPPNIGNHSGIQFVLMMH